MRILSIDWDYFFPDVAQFDWGHRESPMFINMLWPMRVKNRSLSTKRRAFDVVRPRKHCAFIEKYVSAGSMKEVFIHESHMMALEFIKKHPGVHDVVNFDAHHDFGYGEDPGNATYVDCGNWALQLAMLGKVRSYHLVYPSWRKKTPECDGDILSRMKGLAPKIKIMVSYRPIKVEPDAVFMCRSGAWTPPWWDSEFFGMTSRLIGMIPKRMRCFAGAVEKRSMDMADAIHLNSQPSTWEIIQGMRKGEIPDGIKIDWAKVEKYADSRNEREHLEAADTLPAHSVQADGPH